jgi:hypothetical protein
MSPMCRRAATLTSGDHPEPTLIAWVDHLSQTGRPEETGWMGRVAVAMVCLSPEGCP